MKTLFTLHGSQFKCISHLLAFTFFLLFANNSSAQLDFAFASNPNNHLTTEIINTDSDAAVSYMQITTVEKQKGEFKNLQIKISPNVVSGMMSLEINSEKDRSVLIEFKNIIEDVLIYQSFDLKQATIVFLSKPMIQQLVPSG